MKKFLIIFMLYVGPQAREDLDVLAKKVICRRKHNNTDAITPIQHPDILLQRFNLLPNGFAICKLGPMLSC
jgi:hypothetical protein